VNTVLQQFLNGLTLGSTYALLALGIAMVFSILHLVNFAHGELISLCAYAMLGLHYLHVPWIVSVVLGVATSVLAALAMERLAFRPLRHADPLSMMVASLGILILVSFALEAFVSPRARAIPQPAWMNTMFRIGGLQVGLKYILIIVVTGLALLGTLILLRRTIIGTAMRAAAEDFDAVRMMGVKANRVIAASFALSGFLAGIAAVLLLSIRASATPHMGFALVLYGFIGNVIGGLGNLWGAVLGGFILGFLETIFRAFLPASTSGFTNGFLLVIVVVILVRRPQGLIAPKSAARV
jgi:branched-chain amino acid transport system permease protein